MWTANATSASPYCGHEHGFTKLLKLIRSNLIHATFHQVSSYVYPFAALQFTADDSGIGGAVAMLDTSPCCTVSTTCAAVSAVNRGTTLKSELSIRTQRLECDLVRAAYSTLGDENQQDETWLTLCDARTLNSKQASKHTRETVHLLTTAANIRWENTLTYNANTKNNLGSILHLKHVIRCGINHFVRIFKI
jgi:hypothetical protein